MFKKVFNFFFGFHRISFMQDILSGRNLLTFTDNDILDIQDRYAYSVMMVIRFFRENGVYNINDLSEEKRKEFLKEFY